MISPYRPSERGSILAFVDSHLHGLLTHWALVGLLAAYERYLSRIRDSLSVEPQENEKPLKQFSNLTQYFSLSIDISAVAVELRRLAKDEQSLKWNCEDFLPCSQPYQQETKITLAEAIRNHIQHRADWLANVDKSLRSVLIQYGDALGIHENVRLQRRVALLTLVIAGLTIVIAALTALTFLR